VTGILCYTPRCLLLCEGSFDNEMAGSTGASFFEFIGTKKAIRSVNICGLPHNMTRSVHRVEFGHTEIMENDFVFEEMRYPTLIYEAFVCNCRVVQQL